MRGGAYCDAYAGGVSLKEVAAGAAFDANVDAVGSSLRSSLCLTSWPRLLAWGPSHHLRRGSSWGGTSLRPGRNGGLCKRGNLGGSENSPNSQYSITMHVEKRLQNLSSSPSSSSGGGQQPPNIWVMFGWRRDIINAISDWNLR